MTQALASYERYRADSKVFDERLSANGSAWLRDIRKRGLESFIALGFPTARRGNEKWKYTNVGPIARAAFEYPFEADGQVVSTAEIEKLAPWDEGWARLVFVDGQYSEALSSPQPPGNGAYVANLPNALDDNGSLVEEHLGRQALVEDDGFAAVNTAFLGDGAFVHASEDSSSGATVHLVYITTSRTRPTVSYPRTLIVGGRHSKLTVVESYIGLSETDYFTNAVAEIVADDGAQIEHYRYLAESPSAFHIGTTRVQLARDSSFRLNVFREGRQARAKRPRGASRRSRSFVHPEWPVLHHWETAYRQPHRHRPRKASRLK